MLYTLQSLCTNISSAFSVAQSCPTLCNPLDCSLPGSSVRGVFQARILEQVTTSYSRGSSGPKDQKTNSLLLSHRGFPVQGVQRIKRVNVCPLINLHSHYVDEIKRLKKTKKQKNNAFDMSTVMSGKKEVVVSRELLCCSFIISFVVVVVLSLSHV